MFSFSFRNRIAIYNLISAATLILIVFAIIYSIVSFSVNKDINFDLETDLKHHLDFVANQKGSDILLVEPDEWTETEHIEIDINPIFVQIFDSKRNYFQKSPNLKEENLKLVHSNVQTDFEEGYITDIPVRQVQAPLINHGKILGFVVIAMYVEEPILVLNNLKEVLFLTYPIVLLLLFFITRYIAGKSIKPALKIIDTTSRISNNNLSERIVLPQNHDELFALSYSINQLLERIESAVIRERKFTSDASHELRTPLAVIQGTLEVLIRKPRESQEYEEKIKYCISEVNRLNALADQLLILARFENQKLSVKIENVVLDEIILQILERYSSKIAFKKITVSFEFSHHFLLNSDSYLVSVILENLISNAVKYSNENGRIIIALNESEKDVDFKITDNGVGISKENLVKVYDEFFRAESNETEKGTGLGLSIVKRFCVLLQSKFNIESEKGLGTKVTVSFKK